MNRRDFMKFSALSSLALVLPTSLLNASINQQTPDFYVYIDKENCVLCGICEEMSAGNIFTEDAKGMYATVRPNNWTGEKNLVDGEFRSLCEEIAEACTTGAITISDVKLD